MNELEFIESLRALASDPAARGLIDDAAVLTIGDRSLVLTQDMIVEGVHYLPGDPARDVAWKLLAVNLSDLAAKGARPLGVLLSFTLIGEAAWNRDFVSGLGEALGAFGIPLLGGDTVTAPAGAPRSLGMTAIGEAIAPVPSRSGAQPGDQLWVSGTIGDAGAGLEALRAGQVEQGALIERYRNPRPRLEAGQALAPLVSAMMDVSDGLLIDALRLAHASECAIGLELAEIPLSAAYRDAKGGSLDARLAAATAGDDYELLFAAHPDQAIAIARLAEACGLSLTRIGSVETGRGLRLKDGEERVPLPPMLGWEHRATPG
jgi:thiamine-monophosphate kinase